MIKTTLSYYFPPRLGRTMLLALEEVIGKSGLNTLQSFLWRIERCPWCWGRTTFDPVCHFAVGMLQELLYWVNGGKYYNVVEQTRIAQGDSACLVCIDKLPLV